MNCGTGYKRYAIHVMGPPEEEERSGRNISNNNGREISKLMTDTKPQIQETQRTAISINPPSILWHIIFKLQKFKDKEKILKKPKHKAPNLPKSKGRLILTLFQKPYKKRMKLNIQGVKKHNTNLAILYPGKLSFTSKGEILLQINQKMRDLSTVGLP